MKELHFKERCQVRACSSAVLLHAVVFFPPLYSHKHTHTNTHTQYKKGRAEILFARHNFVWQRWQIVFYDWTGFSGLFGTHPPTMQCATVTALPATLAQRRCLMWGSTLKNFLFIYLTSVCPVEELKTGEESKDSPEERERAVGHVISSRVCICQEIIMWWDYLYLLLDSLSCYMHSYTLNGLWVCVFLVKLYLWAHK